MPSFTWLPTLAAAASIALTGPALGAGEPAKSLEAGRDAGAQSGICTPACLEIKLQHLVARLHALLDHTGVASPNATIDTTRAYDDRWQHMAAVYCAAIAASEPVPTYDTALLECAVSVMSDRVAKIENERSVATVLGHQHGASVGSR